MPDVAQAFCGIAIYISRHITSAAVDYLLVPVCYLSWISIGLYSCAGVKFL